MSKIYCIIGKGGVGKDTVYAALMKEQWVKDNFETIVTYTTRPIKPSDIEGETYNFVKFDELEDTLEKIGESNIIDIRFYNVAGGGKWYYFTSISGLLPNSKYIVVSSVAQYENYVNFQKSSNGEHTFIPIYITLNSEMRLTRMIKRRIDDATELANFDILSMEDRRRYLADEADYDVPLIWDIPESNIVCNDYYIELTIKGIMDILKN